VSRLILVIREELCKTAHETNRRRPPISPTDR
jgi:hypothetical protein